ncbi:MAG: Ger(x)C family spore germination protein [Bacillota bacterium]
MRRWSAAGLMLLSLLLSGCWDRREIEDTIYVASIGVDAQGDEYLWTFRVVEAERLTLGMLTAVTAEPGRLASGVITVRATSLQQAVQLLQPSIMRVISLEHVRWIGFGEEVANQGLGPLLSQFLRHNQIRRSANIYLVRGTALYPFLNNRPVGDLNPMKFFETARLVQKRFHLSPPVQLQHYYARLSSPGVDPMIAVVGVNEMAKEQPGSELPAMGGRSLKGGEVPRNGGNPAEFMGTAIFRGDRLAGTLSVDETAAVLALRGEMGKVYMSVPDPREEGVYITIRLHQENKPRYRADFRNHRPIIHVRLQFEAELLSTPGMTDYSQPENRRALERSIANDYLAPLFRSLTDKVYSDWGADPAGFGQLFRSRFATFDDWVAYRWTDKVPDLKVTVESDVFIRRFGMLLSSDIPEN